VNIGLWNPKKVFLYCAKLDIGHHYSKFCSRNNRDTSFFILLNSSNLNRGGKKLSRHGKMGVKIGCKNRGGNSEIMGKVEFLFSLSY